MEIAFTSDLPEQEVAEKMALLVARWYAQDAAEKFGTPYEEPEQPIPVELNAGGRWWELLTNNNHKVFVRGDGRYRYFDRYFPEPRMTWLREQLEQAEWATVVQ